MTSTINGIGTHLSGGRELTEEEYKLWGEKLPFIPGLNKKYLRIATKSFVVLFLPLIPLETIIYYYTDNSHYREIFYPAGKDKVYWSFVFNSPLFYTAYFLLLILLIWALI